MGGDKVSYEQIDEITAALETELASHHPNEAPWLVFMAPIKPLWGGGFDMLGQKHDTLDSAVAAQRRWVLYMIEQLEATP